MSHMAKNAHKAGKPHHKNEMEHHKLRDKHHAAYSAQKPSSGGIVDPKMANDSHKEGISRVKQKMGDMPVGQHGSMAGGWKHDGLK